MFQHQLCSSNPLPIVSSSSSSSHLNQVPFTDPETELDRLASQINNQPSNSAQNFSYLRANKLKHVNYYNSVSTHHLQTASESITESMFRQTLASELPVKPSREKAATAKVVLGNEDNKDRKLLKHIKITKNSTKGSDSEKRGKARNKEGAPVLKGCLKHTSSVSSPSEQSDLLMNHLYQESLVKSLKNSTSDWGDSSDVTSQSRSHSSANMNPKPRGNFLFTPKGDENFAQSNFNSQFIPNCSKPTNSSLSSTPNSDDFQSFSNSNSLSGNFYHPSSNLPFRARSR